MDKIKVVHIITKLELGGAQVNTIYTYEHLDASCFEPWLICGPGGILTEGIVKKENLVILNYLKRAINPFNDLKAYFHMRKLLRQIKPDIVHTHSSKAGIIGRLAAFAAGVPVIIHSVHGFSFSPFQSFLKRNIYIAAEKFVASRTTHFIFVSKDDIQIAREKKLIADNFSLIRSGFPFPKFLEKGTDTELLREKYHLAPTDFVCGVIAPFKAQKGLFHLIEIAARVIGALAGKREVRFLITGDGSLRPAIEAKLKEKNIYDYFRLPGFILDIEKTIAIFDLGISTALWEGLPQSLVQLRLKKKAIVASDIPGNREVVQNNQNGFLVQVDDYLTFSQKVITLIENEVLRTEMANFASEDFSAWNADFMVKEQESLYRRLQK